MLTEKDYCDYDTCAALMEIGFNISDRCVPDYLEGKRIHIWDAQKWLREDYKEKPILGAEVAYKNMINKEYKVDKWLEEHYEM